MNIHFPYWTLCLNSLLKHDNICFMFTVAILLHIKWLFPVHNPDWSIIAVFYSPNGFMFPLHNTLSNHPLQNKHIFVLIDTVH